MLPPQVAPSAGQPVPAPYGQPQGIGDMFAGIAQGLGELVTGTINQFQESLPLAPLDEKEQAVDTCLAQQGGFVVARRKPAKPPLPPGALGKGAFGVVYLANKGGTEYAVKLIEGLSKNKRLILQEIEILRILDHPSVVNLVWSYCEEARDWMFIVMDFVDGGDLLVALTKSAYVFDEALIRVVLFHSSCALAYAHQRRVVHRDLKPENILLRKRDFLPKIADFGISKVIGENSICMTMAGTMPYMAPEVSDQNTYTFSADMYSLGRIVTDMLHPERLVSWISTDMMHPMDQQKFRKQFPAGMGACVPGERLALLNKELLNEMPGKRPTGYSLCKELVTLQKQDPRPHVLWNEPTKAPDGPPPPKGISPEAAAQIAGARGYAVGVPVEMKLAEGHWVPGTVEHISSGLCPGAAQVRYQAPNGTEGSALVCPWQFKEILRPAPQSRKSEGSPSKRIPEEDEGGARPCCCSVQ